MNDATSSRHGQRGRKVRSNRARLAVEVLEARTLPSVNFVEVEPNNTAAQANVLQRVLDENVIVSGRVNSLGDRDWFKIELKQGDVIGATLNGQNRLNPSIRLVNADGELMIGNDDSLISGANFLPAESPLPHTSSDQDSQIYYVISAPGIYAIEVSASNDATTGKYELDLVVARPAMEKQPVGAKQILFLDFDGARVNFSHFVGKSSYPGGNRDVLPLAHSLPDWGLTAADEDAVIDAIVADVTRRLSTFVRANGLNGDYDLTGIPGQFGIEIRNSRDHADEFGTNPLVSRVVIGLMDEKFPAVGAAAVVDVGNFKTNDEAVANVYDIEFLLQVVPIQSPNTVIDFIGSVAGGVASHEAGHLFGCFHTELLDSDRFAGITTLMDPELSPTIGEDGVFGSADDRDLLFRADAYYHAEPFRGFNDTLNTVSFGLATGKRAPALHATAMGGNRAGGTTLTLGQVERLLGEALTRWQAAGVDTSGLSTRNIRIADLGGTTLGLASGNTIWLDDNAADWGWFVDPTPWDDSEFTTPGDQGEQGRMDLLTVMMHELGHVLGLDHDDQGVMQETLAAGERPADPGLEPRVGTARIRDGVFTAWWSGPSLEWSALGVLMALQDGDDRS